MYEHPDYSWHAFRREVFEEELPDVLDSDKPGATVVMIESLIEGEEDAAGFFTFEGEPDELCEDDIQWMAEVFVGGLRAPASSNRAERRLKQKRRPRR